MSSIGLFDLSREPDRIRERYGPTRYGADCLTARRLIEAGVPFVLIQCFGTRCDWDWHYEAFSHLSKYMLGVFDHVTTTLIEDLRQRGLWDETLLICTGEFGRTPAIGSNEANGYGGRAHYGKNYAMMLGGGPIRGGQVVGATNKNGTEIIDRPVTVGDLYRTYYPALGLSPSKKFYVAGQPLPLQEEGKQTITELLA
jgi:arylsulfatase A-like enzyme